MPDGPDDLRRWILSINLIESFLAERFLVHHLQNLTEGSSITLTIQRIPYQGRILVTSLWEHIQAILLLKIMAVSSKKIIGIQLRYLVD